MKKRAIIATEAQEQMAVVEWFASYAPTRGLDARLLCCSANGAMLAGDARLRAIQMQKLKKMGLVPGDPDLFLRVRRGSFCGLYGEMKRSDWREPKSGKTLVHYKQQCEIAAILKKDYCVRQWLGADQARHDIIEYLGLR